MSDRVRRQLKHYFEIGEAKKTYRCYISSGGDADDNIGTRLHLAFSPWSLIVRLPQILKPAQRKVQASYWSAEDTARMGQDWYRKYVRREYGFYLFENHFNIMYGEQAMTSHTQKRWSTFLPWTCWRLHRYSLYDASWHLFWTSTAQRDLHSEEGQAIYERERHAEGAVPKKICYCVDYDSAVIIATCYIAECEWRLGEGKWSWLSKFWKPQVRRSLDMLFDKEVGAGKHSWKGGIVDAGIEMSEFETPLSAFMRFCGKHNLQIAGELK